MAEVELMTPGYGGQSEVYNATGPSLGPSLGPSVTASPVRAQGSGFGGEGTGKLEAKLEQLDTKFQKQQKMMWVQMVFLGAVFITQVIIGIVLASKVDDFVARATTTADDADQWMADMMATGQQLKATGDQVAAVINTTADKINITADSLLETGGQLKMTADNATDIIAATGDIINSTAQTIVNPSKAANLVGGMFSDMMLGRPDGTLAAYLQDMTENDWSQVASTAQPLANYVRDAMKGAAAGKNCAPAYQQEACADSSYPPFYGPYEMCANGQGTRRCICLSSTYDPSSGNVCSPGGWVKDCTPETPRECMMNDISDKAAVVGSILDKAKLLKRVTPETDIGEPAMSHGLLRLNWMTNWTIAQGGPAGVAAYKTLSKQCKSLVTNVLDVAWSGNWSDQEGAPQTWDVRSNVQDVCDWVTMFCDALDS